MHRWKIYHPRSTDPERREPLAFKSSNRVSLTFSLTIFSIRKRAGCTFVHSRNGGQARKRGFSDARHRHAGTMPAAIVLRPCHAANTRRRVSRAARVQVLVDGKAGCVRRHGAKKLRVEFSTCPSCRRLHDVGTCQHMSGHKRRTPS